MLNKKPQSPADIGQIAKHLNAISTKAPEYKEVPALLKKTAVEEKRLIKETAERLRIKGIKDREEYIDLLEKVYLKQGMDVHLTASGRDKKVLTFKYIFVSRPFVYQMSTSSDVINNLKNLGFEKVIFTDGYNSSWSMDVK